MLCIDLSSAHGDREHLDAPHRHTRLRDHGTLFSHATVERGAHREEADLRRVLHRSDRLPAMLDLVPYPLLPFATSVEAF